MSRERAQHILRELNKRQEEEPGYVGHRMKPQEISVKKNYLGNQTTPEIKGKDQSLNISLAKPQGNQVCLTHIHRYL